MKNYFFQGFVWFVCASGMVSGQEKEPDPFSDEDWKKIEAIEDAPETWEVRCEVFSMPFAEAVKLRRKMKGHGKMYSEIVKRVDGKKVVLEEFSVLKGRVGRETAMESIEEYTYPSEYDPPETPNEIAKVPKNEGIAKMLITPSNPTSYETKNLGVSMSLEINRKETSRTIVAELGFTLVTMVDEDLWGRDMAEAAVPRFEVQAVEKTLVLGAKKPILVGTMSPPKKAGEKKSDVWFLFATALAGEK